MPEYSRGGHVSAAKPYGELPTVPAGPAPGAMPVVDLINHPPHYSGFSNGAEVIDIAECLNFNRGNAVKYLARAGAKDPGRELEDLRKSLWYVAREIERMQGRA